MCSVLVMEVRLSGCTVMVMGVIVRGCTVMVSEVYCDGDGSEGKCCVMVSGNTVMVGGCTVMVKVSGCTVMGGWVYCDGDGSMGKCCVMVGRVYCDGELGEMVAFCVSTHPGQHDDSRMNVAIAPDCG